MERNNVMVTLKKKNEFSSESIVQDLNTLIKFKEGQQQNVQSLPEINLNLAMSATSALIKYLDVSIVCTNNGKIFPTGSSRIFIIL